MKNHRWNNNTCVKCGITRTQRTKKLLMAITNHPPYDHYKYIQFMEYCMAYGDIKHYTVTRPDCNNKFHI